jgi:hypothetical protein
MSVRTVAAVSYLSQKNRGKMNLPIFAVRAFETEPKKGRMSTKSLLTSLARLFKNEKKAEKENLLYPSLARISPAR